MPSTKSQHRSHNGLKTLKRIMSFKRKYLAIPYFVFLILFVLIPIVIILVYAFTKTDDLGNLTFSWNSLVEFFSSPTKLNVLVVSLFIGILNTIFCLLIGYPIAYLLADKKVNKNYVMVMLFVMPMWINFVLRTGATRDVLYMMGIKGGEQPYVATMIGLVYNYLPFTILPLYTTMIKLDKSQIEAARDLGCNPAQTFVHSVLPQSIPGIVSAAEMVFMPTMSSYVISDTLSEGKLTLFGNSIANSFNNSLWNDGSFMAFIMLALIFLTMFITNRFHKDETMEKGRLW
ncbi:MAG: ABC transporter permease [Erysipelotrichaceae bacterium]|nr:ABC transporter permease [Erysipelotrichaceae bacterium]